MDRFCILKATPKYQESKNHTKFLKEKIFRGLEGLKSFSGSIWITIISYKPFLHLCFTSVGMTTEHDPGCTNDLFFMF